ncbi:MAG: type II secretion system protein [Clostridia bacterium]|nr:type II secretion system protein [Clostridia bacterium]
MIRRTANVKKGTTLVEVLVAIAVFSIISVAMFSSLLVMRKTVARQEEYLRFEMICSDIAFFGDEYGREWDQHYFPLNSGQDEGKIYYGYDFHPSTTEQVYCLSYSYADTNDDGFEELIVSIHHVESGRVIVENLNYGGERYK